MLQWLTESIMQFAGPEKVWLVISDKYPEAVAVLADGLEDSLQFYAFPEFDHRKIAFTSVLERMFRGVRRRSRVVGYSPAMKRTSACSPAI
jgi:transposase-like protein